MAFYASKRANQWYNFITFQVIPQPINLRSFYHPSFECGNLNTSVKRSQTLWPVSYLYYTTWLKFRTILVRPWAPSNSFVWQYIADELFKLQGGDGDLIEELKSWKPKCQFVSGFQKNINPRFASIPKWFEGMTRNKYEQPSLTSSSTIHSVYSIRLISIT